LALPFYWRLPATGSLREIGAGQTPEKTENLPPVPTLNFRPADLLHWFCYRELMSPAVDQHDATVSRLPGEGVLLFEN
jgi:hypothetical protein